MPGINRLLEKGGVSMNSRDWRFSSGTHFSDARSDYFLECNSSIVFNSLPRSTDVSLEVKSDGGGGGREFQSILSGKRVVKECVGVDNGG